MNGELKTKSESKRWEERFEAASNPKTPEEILTKLSEDFDWRVRAGVAGNKKFIQKHGRIGRTLLKDENKLVRAYTAKSLGKDEDVKTILSEQQDFVE